MNHIKSLRRDKAGREDRAGLVAEDAEEDRELMSNMVAGMATNLCKIEVAGMDNLRNARPKSDAGNNWTHPGE